MRCAAVTQIAFERVTNRKYHKWQWWISTHLTLNLNKNVIYKYFSFLMLKIVILHPHECIWSYYLNQWLTWYIYNIHNIKSQNYFYIPQYFQFYSLTLIIDEHIRFRRVDFINGNIFCFRYYLEGCFDIHINIYLVNIV